MSHLIRPCRRLLLAAATCVVLAGPKIAGAAHGITQREGAKPSSYMTAAGSTSADERVVTSHSIKLRGKSLRYTATAGRLTIKDDEDKPIAHMFYVAYVKSGEEPRRRPVSFLFNGGPGSSTMYLHMGSFGPFKVRIPGPERPTLTAPELKPNRETLLPESDLVFVDMVGTGYSRPADGVEGKRFWSVDGDADSFARFGRAWSQQNQRMLSPRFLIGESYGSARAAVLANRLASSGMSIAGLALIGPILNFGLFHSGYDQNYISYVPSLAASAWYHGVATPSAGLPELIEEARVFADGPYRAALSKGDGLSPAEASAVAQKLSELTGLSSSYILRAKLRIDPDNFRKELLRSTGRTIGRFDGRYLGQDGDDLGATADLDPAGLTFETSLTTALGDYLQRDLRYSSSLTYRTGIQDLAVFDFDFRHSPPLGSSQLLLNAGFDLAHAIRSDPNLRVTLIMGYYDLATPFGAAGYDLSHLMLGIDERRRLSVRYYRAGHMPYLEAGIAPQLHDDLADFVSGSKTPMGK